MNSWRLVGPMLLVLAVAIFGKGIACMLTARTLGESWCDSAAIGGGVRYWRNVDTLIDVGRRCGRIRQRQENAQW